MKKGKKGIGHVLFWSFWLGWNTFVHHWKELMLKWNVSILMRIHKKELNKKVTQIKWPLLNSKCEMAQFYTLLKCMKIYTCNIQISVNFCEDQDMSMSVIRVTHLKQGWSFLDRAVFPGIIIRHLPCLSLVLCFAFMLVFQHIFGGLPFTILMTFSHLADWVHRGLFDHCPLF